MFETVFGSEVPLAARFFIAFLVVLALIGLTAWLVRRFGSNRLGSSARGRQPRLAVIDAATVDGRRRLVLVRRDNTEHLLMIGGPTDVVVEANIVRATGMRETAKGPALAATVDSQWPLQPLNEPPPIPVPAPAASRLPRAAVTEEPWLPPEPGAKPRPADSLSGLAAELSTKLTPPEAPARSEPRPSPPPVIPPLTEPPAAPAQTDQSLAEMAHQLEAALRRAPAPESRPPVTDPLAALPPRPMPPRDVKPRLEPKFEPREARPDLRNEVKAEPKIEAPEPKHEPKPASARAPFDNLEEEMANLLGRPSGKT